MYDTGIALVVDEFQGFGLAITFFRVWRVMNSKDVLTRWWLGVSSQVENEDELVERETSADDPRIFGEWKVKAEAWHELRLSLEDF